MRFPAQGLVALTLALTVTSSGVAHAGRYAPATVARSFVQKARGWLPRARRDTPAMKLQVKDTGEEKLSLSDRIADKVSNFASTPKYLYLLSAGTAGWMAVHNSLGDPELIKLNLAISIVTMLTAAVGGISQGRAVLQDRKRAEQDLQVDIKAEKEIAELHQKLDAVGVQLAALNAQLAAKNAVEGAAHGKK